MMIRWGFKRGVLKCKENAIKSLKLDFEFPSLMSPILNYVHLEIFIAVHMYCVFKI